MNPNHKLAVESAQAVPGSETWERRPSLSACFGQSVLAGAPRDGRRSQEDPFCFSTPP